MRFELTDEERRRFDEWVDHQRSTTIKQMADSSLVVHIVPIRPQELDIEYALQLGASILMGKPIIAIIPAGREIPGKLELVLDHRVDLDNDIDTEAGKLELQRKLTPILEQLK